MYAEDLVWCYEIKKMGYTIYYNAETSVIHHMGASSAASVLNQKHQNEYDFVVKNYGWTYAKLLVFLRGILCFSVSRNQDIVEIRKIYTKLFLSGKVI
jgi:GT2 family glycosyltransferase